MFPITPIETGSLHPLAFSGEVPAFPMSGAADSITCAISEEHAPFFSALSVREQKFRPSCFGAYPFWINFGQGDTISFEH
jgi:hypothetical protein